jgi:hypothetical protein
MLPFRPPRPPPLTLLPVVRKKPETYQQPGSRRRTEGADPRSIRGTRSRNSLNVQDNGAQNGQPGAVAGVTRTFVDVECAFGEKEAHDNWRILFVQYSGVSYADQHMGETFS